MAGREGESGGVAGGDIITRDVATPHTHIQAKLSELLTHTPDLDSELSLRSGTSSSSVWRPRKL